MLLYIAVWGSMKNFIKEYKKNYKAFKASPSYEKTKYENRIVFITFLLTMPTFLFLSHIINSHFQVSEFITSSIAFILSICITYGYAGAKSEAKFNGYKKQDDA